MNEMPLMFLQYLPYPRAQHSSMLWVAKSCYFLIFCAYEVENIVKLDATQEFKLFVSIHLLPKSLSLY